MSEDKDWTLDRCGFVDQNGRRCLRHFDHISSIDYRNHVFSDHTMDEAPWVLLTEARQQLLAAQQQMDLNKEQEGNVLSENESLMRALGQERGKVSRLNEEVLRLTRELNSLRRGFDSRGWNPAPGGEPSNIEGTGVTLVSTPIKNDEDKFADLVVRLECLEKRVMSLEDFRSSAYEKDRDHKLEDIIQKAWEGDRGARDALRILVGEMKEEK